MKKLKLLVPTITASVLAMTPLFSMTSCSSKEVDKTLAGYTVDKDTYRIYGLNKQGQRFELSDKQIKALEGGFLLTLGDESFIYVDEEGQGSDGNTYPTSIDGWMDRAKDQHAFYYEIWLCGGEYDLDEPDNDSHIKFDIKGVVGNDGKLTSSVNIIPGHDPDGETTISTDVDVGDFKQLNFSTVNIIGSKNEKQGFGWHIEGADEMTFTYCHFDGLAVFRTEYLDLYGCTIDSDCIKWRDADPSNGRAFSTTQYGLVVDDVDFASFSYCNFISDGKAVKLYPLAKNDEPTYVFNTCTFKIGDKGIPPEDHILEAGHNDQDKSALDVNTQRVDAPEVGEDPHLHIYWYEITGNILGEGETRDWKNHRAAIDGDRETSGAYDPEKIDFQEGKLPA
ncbi:MAG: hypothetical protein ACOQNV_00295 [Mycoplasmoidaceae bacterium]